MERFSFCPPINDNRFANNVTTIEQNYTHIAIKKPLLLKRKSITMHTFVNQIKMSHLPFKKDIFYRKSDYDNVDLFFIPFINSPRLILPRCF